MMIHVQSMTSSRLCHISHAQSHKNLELYGYQRKKRSQKGKFWVRIGLLNTSKCTWTTPKRANLHDISVIYPIVVSSCVLDLSGAHRGVSCLFSQWRALFELWWRPNLSTLWEGICKMDTSRAPLYLVHFWPEFMVLGKKRPLVRVIACNLQKCGKNAIFWA